MWPIATHNIITLRSKRRSARLVTQATSGGDRQTTAAPRLINSPTVPIETPNPDANSGIIPAGASMLRPITKLPSARATRGNWLRIIPVFRSAALRRWLARLAYRAGVGRRSLPPGFFLHGFGDPINQLADVATDRSILDLRVGRQQFDDRGVRNELCRYSACRLCVVLEERADRNAEDLGDQRNPPRADAVRALFIF